jgi:hypothetical protein
MKLYLVLTSISVTAVAVAQNFGPDVIDRPNVDQAHEITFISGVHAAPSAGEISEWRLWASGTGDVTLQMWRPIANGFQLVGFNTVTVSSLGFNTLQVNSGRIAVQAGDVLGFRYNQTFFGPRIIDFSSGVGGPYRWTNWPDPSTNVPIGGILQNSQLTGLTEGREYSLAATVVVPEPATLAVLGLGSMALLRRRRR